MLKNTEKWKENEQLIKETVRLIAFELSSYSNGSGDGSTSSGSLEDKLAGAADASSSSSTWFGNENDDNQNRLKEMKRRKFLSSIRSIKDIPASGCLGSEEFIRRFLQSKKYDPVRCSKSILTYLEWYASEEVELLRSPQIEPSSKEILDFDVDQVDKWTPQYIRGRDDYGRSVVYVNLKEWDPYELMKHVPLKKYIRYHTYLRERLIWYLDYQMLDDEINGKFQTSENDGSVCLIINLASKSLGPTSTQLFTLFKEVSHIDQMFFPERLKTIFILNPPFVFSLAWSFVKRWISERTVSKIKIVQEEDIFNELKLAKISLDDYPSDFPLGKGPPLQESEMVRHICTPLYQKKPQPIVVPTILTPPLPPAPALVTQTSTGSNSSTSQSSTPKLVTLEKKVSWQVRDARRTPSPLLRESEGQKLLRKALMELDQVEQSAIEENQRLRQSLRVLSSVPSNLKPKAAASPAKKIQNTKAKGSASTNAEISSKVADGDNESYEHLEAEIQELSMKIYEMKEELEGYKKAVDFANNFVELEKQTRKDASEDYMNEIKQLEAKNKALCDEFVSCYHYFII